MKYAQTLRVCRRINYVKKSTGFGGKTLELLRRLEFGDKWGNDVKLQ